MYTWKELTGGKIINLRFSSGIKMSEQQTTAI